MSGYELWVPYPEVRLPGVDSNESYGFEKIKYRKSKFCQRAEAKALCAGS